MRRIALCLALLAAGAFAADSPAPSIWDSDRRATEPSPKAGVLPLISVKGNHFVDPTGATVLFRGVSIAETNPRIGVTLLHELLAKVAPLELAPRKKIPGLSPERADVFPVALLAAFVVASQCFAAAPAAPGMVAPPGGILVRANFGHCYTPDAVIRITATSLMPKLSSHHPEE